MTPSQPPRPRRILVVNPGADVYGSDVQMLRSVEAFTQVGWQVAVVLPEHGPLEERITPLGAAITHLDFPRLQRAYLSPSGLPQLAAQVAAALPRLVRFLRRHRPDVLYVNTKTLPWWLLAARLAGIPSLCHVHEADDASGRLLATALSAPLLAADRLVLVSEASKSHTCDPVPLLRRSAYVVHNGMPDRPTPPAPLPLPQPGRRTRLIQVARVQPHKAADVSIAALALLVERGHDVELDIVGEPFPGYEWYVEGLRAQAEQAGLTDRVLFSGFVHPTWDHLDAAMVALAPAVRDSFGLTTVEAQLSERPVVAAAAGGHLELIDDGVTGLLVPPRDATALADAVETLLVAPERARRIGQASRIIAVRRFGQIRYSEEIRSQVDQLVM